MKNKSLTTLAAIVLLVTMIALIVISGTFSKYTTQYNGEGTAIVANWNISVTDLKGGTYTKDQTVNIFDKSMVYDLKNVTDFTTAVGEDDTDVANGTDKAIVAPGTWGKIGFVVTVGSSTDVTVEYRVDITELTTNLPLKFSLDGTTWKTAEAIKADPIATKTVTPTGSDSVNTVTLYWKWDFVAKDENGNVIAANDVADTTIGETGTDTCTIKTKLVATQVD